MAIETVRKLRCDLCGEYVPLTDRRRLGVRRDEDRPEETEWVDACGPCRNRPHALDEVIVVAEKRWTEADG